MEGWLPLMPFALLDSLPAPAWRRPEGWLGGLGGLGWGREKSSTTATEHTHSCRAVHSRASASEVCLASRAGNLPAH